jgi:phosphopantothenoylcysteine decarboxylase / phosphopantothenate---cysteine ligase
VRKNIRKADKFISILVTAGPTREKIDPVRFISNYSTGTFGYEIAAEAARQGSDVTLISGPTCLKSAKRVKLVEVESALEMRREVLKRAARNECIIMAAAVCDWRARFIAKDKIKRQGGRKTLELIENPDILKELGRGKKGVLVGFALETEDLKANALSKLKQKSLDMIVANKLSLKKAIFGNKRTDILIIDRLGRKERYRRKTKRELAKIILDRAANFKI